MPNHCYQQVTLSGPLDLMREIHEELFKSCREGFEPQLLQLILPMPFSMNKYTEDENGNFNAGWYDWRVENWGCKWDVAEEVTFGFSDGQFQGFGAQNPFGGPDCSKNHNSDKHSGGF